MLYYYVDRFEGDLAELISEDRTWTCPRYILPPGTREGDVLLRTADGFERCPEETNAARREMIQLRLELLGRDAEKKEETS